MKLERIHCDLLWCIDISVHITSFAHEQIIEIQEAFELGWPVSQCLENIRQKACLKKHRRENTSTIHAWLPCKNIHLRKGHAKNLAFKSQSNSITGYMCITQLIELSHK